jgi:uncharacterized protein involved in exopolysaccharide biosynthesis
MHNVNDPQEQDVDILEYWHIIWSRRIMLVLLFTVSVLVTMIAGLLSPKYYRSETVIAPVMPEAGGLAAALSNLPLAGTLVGDSGFQKPADKIMIVLKSRTLAEQVVRKFDLLPTFYETKWDSEKKAWKDPEKHPFMQDAVMMLLDNVVDLKKSKEGIVTISVEWKDPVLAADIANYYVAALTEFIRDKAMNMTILVVDRAVPAERKSRPKIALNMALAGVASLFIGVFIAFFLTSLQKRKAISS